MGNYYAMANDRCRELDHEHVLPCEDSFDYIVNLEKRISGLAGAEQMRERASRTFQPSEKAVPDNASWARRNYMSGWNQGQRNMAERIRALPLEEDDAEVS